MMDGSIPTSTAHAQTLQAFLAEVERRAFRHAEIALRHRDDALDAVQDAMLKLVQRYADRPALEWTPLFWRVLRSRITDIQRRRKVRSVLVGWMGSGAEQDDGPAWEPVDPTPGPATIHSDRESYKALATALQALPRRQREAYQWRVLEGLDVADTARVMGCSEGSVKTHTSRAMDALRKQLEDWR
ncbi:MAG: RNA polymerase sigma factor [Proteobacteria bacterium]|nr:RNA polymerase sigma factor [Pseudomonadota bacterium]MBS0461135.1 RNA polymerase sigma factor [Pseudomonadota bacterium]MBS0464212.1 RNA polymerase sigma factor [Pseudomonadota bacterium]